jgi:hypothetical protein
MASTLTVDNIIADTIVGGTSSSKVHAPGHVVQVVTNNVTGVVGQNSTAWVNMISVSITPHFSNSKMYISAFIGGVYMNLSSQTNQSNWRLARDSGGITGANAHFHTEEGRNLTGAGTRTHPAMAIIDPTSGSGSRTYSVQSERHSGSGGIQINDTAGTSTITVMEIAQ